MRNTIITTAFIVSVIFSASNVFAFGNESQKIKRIQNKEPMQLMKFSVNDFLGKEDANLNDIHSAELQKTEVNQRTDDKHETPGTITDKKANQ